MSIQKHDDVVKHTFLEALEAASRVTPLNISGSRWSNRHWSFCELWDISPQVARYWLAMDIYKETGCAT